MQDATIFPRPTASKGMMSIVPAEDPPKHIITRKENYSKIDPKAYNNIYKGNPNKIKECLTMGFRLEGKPCIKTVADDLKKIGSTTCYQTGSSTRDQLHRDNSGPSNHH